MPRSLDEFATRAKSFDWTAYKEASPQRIDQWLRINDTAMVAVIDSIAISEVNGQGFKPRNRNEAISHVSSLLCEGCGIGRFVLDTLKSPAHYTTDEANIDSNAKALVLKHTEYDPVAVSAALDGPVFDVLDRISRKDSVARKVLNEDDATFWQLALLTKGIRLALAEEDLFRLSGSNPTA